MWINSLTVVDWVGTSNLTFLGSNSFQNCDRTLEAGQVKSMGRKGGEKN